MNLKKPVRIYPNAFPQSIGTKETWTVIKLQIILKQSPCKYTFKENINGY